MKPIVRVVQVGLDKRVRATAYKENKVLINKDPKAMFAIAPTALRPWEIVSQDASQILAHTTVTMSP